MANTKQIQVSEIQRSNLRKLAEGLRRFAEDPKPPFGFSMEKFQELGGKNISLGQLEVKNTPCGTVTCAAGLGPYLGIHPEDSVSNWVEYTEKCFVGEDHPELFDWLFASEWARVDNTRLGAAQRIEWYLANGIPDNIRQPYTSVDCPRIPKDDWRGLTAQLVTWWEEQRIRPVASSVEEGNS